jgi:hypothetical protein
MAEAGTRLILFMLGIASVSSAFQTAPRRKTIRGAPITAAVVAVVRIAASRHFNSVWTM